MDELLPARSVVTVQDALPVSDLAPVVAGRQVQRRSSVGDPRGTRLATGGPVRHVNRCNIPHFVIMKATTGQEGEPAMVLSAGIYTWAGSRNDPWANHGGYQ